MTRHLVSLLRKTEQAALRKEIIARLNVAESTLREFAEQQQLEYDALPPPFVEAVVSACLSGVADAPDEVRGLRPSQIRESETE
ncbi:MAG: hypothetical protein QOE90_2398 [Thermoplasmata archaeon]|jgi:hypothetical protein|nr:hypothetical protein [Thermoplasmata archaeon]